MELLGIRTLLTQLQCEALRKIRAPRNLQFGAFFLVTLFVFRGPLHELVVFSLSSDLFFYILLIPFVSAYFVYVRKETTFSNLAYSFPVGSLIILAGFILYFLGKEWSPQLTQNDYLAVMTVSALVTWLGGFIFFYGIQTFRRAAFPVCFLFLMVPLPSMLLEQAILMLQKGSAEAADWIFKITGVPAQRNGFTFSLSKIEIEVAKQCSGIRSSLYLFITSLVFGQLFLSAPMKRAVLTLSVLPLTLFKNGLRIATLALLGNYVDVAILSSSAHRRGGIPFMIVAVALLAVFVRLLRKTEESSASSSGSSESCGKYRA